MEIWQYLVVFCISLYLLNIHRFFIRPNFRGKTVWITGASSGIGESLAYEFARAEASLVLSARNQAELDRVASRCTEACRNTEQSIKVVPLDITQFDETMQIVREHLKEINVDILVNNAGMSQRTLCLETVNDINVEKKILDLNFMGSVAMTKAILPQLVEKRSGQIVNINSVAGIIAGPLRTAYSASKFALKGYMEALRAEVAEYNVIVTDIYPGFVQTNIAINAISADGGKFGKVDDDISSGMPVSKFASKALYSIYTRQPESIIAQYKISTLILLKKISYSLYNKLLILASKSRLSTRSSAK